MKPEDMKKRGRYNWRNQPERLIYLGKNWSGNGYWHQFAKIGDPRPVWCEITDAELPMIEETVTRNLSIAGFAPPYSIYDHDEGHYLPGAFEVWDEAKAEMVRLRGFEHNLCVDGHTHPDPESNWDGEGQYPPFAIFDIDRQENLKPYYLTRRQAEMAMARITGEGQ